MGDAYPRAPQRRSDYEDGAAGLAPRTRLFVTRSPVGGNKIARIATRGLFNLIRGPGMVHPGQPVLDAVLIADAIEDVLAVPDVFLTRGELYAIVGQDDVDAIRHCRRQISQKLRCLHLSGTFNQTNEGELAGAIDRHE